MQAVSAGEFYYPSFLNGETEAQSGEVGLSSWDRRAGLHAWLGSSSLPSIRAKCHPLPSLPWSPPPDSSPPGRAEEDSDGFGPAFIFILNPCISRLLSLPLHFSSCRRMTSENVCDPEKLSSLLFHRIIFCPLVWTSLGDF